MSVWRTVLVLWAAVVGGVVLTAIVSWTAMTWIDRNPFGPRVATVGLFAVEVGCGLGAVAAWARRRHLRQRRGFEVIR